MPILWDQLLIVRSECTDYLMQLSLNTNQNCKNKLKSSIEPNVSNLCCEIVNNWASTISDINKVKNYQEQTKGYVEKFEVSNITTTDSEVIFSFDVFYLRK